MSKKVSVIFSFLVFVLFFNTACRQEVEKNDEPPPVIIKTLNDRGKGSFRFTAYEPLKDKPVVVHFYSPKENPSDLPIVFVMHGVNRNADDYRDNWVSLAEEYQCLIIAPEFSKDLYPKSRSYNLGNLFEDGNPVPQEKWTFSIIEPLFDHILSEINGSQTGYYMFGHSAGSQFVHRFLTFKPNNRAIQLVAANAGWYTLPNFDFHFPYGLQGSLIDEAKIPMAFKKQLIILLGENDVIRDGHLRTTPEADEQGQNRFERGLYYFQAARNRAEELDIAFNWTKITVPEVGHDNALMAISAASVFFE